MLVWGFDTHTSTMFTAGFTYFFSQGYLKYINRFLMKYPWIPTITFSINKYLKEFISFTFQFVFNWCEKKHCSYLIYSFFCCLLQGSDNHESWRKQIYDSSQTDLLPSIWNIWDFTKTYSVKSNESQIIWFLNHFHQNRKLSLLEV